LDESSILIVGANGQLGQALQKRYPGARAVDREEIDITDREAIKNFDWEGIKIILNAAAYTNVDGAETPEGRRLAWKVNAVGAANLADIADHHDLTLLHISSDYVFDGSSNEHSEEETFTPLGVYGQSKAAGDIAVSLVPKQYILRTSWVIGDGPNFVRTMLSVGSKGIEPTVVADQIGRLTFTSELVRAIEHLLESKADFGTYNVSNGGDPASWSEITRAIFKEAGFDLKVSDTTTAEYFASKPETAPRPLQSTLNLDKISATGFEPTNWEEDLAKYVKQELSK